jgi:hypothetical protein
MNSTPSTDDPDPDTHPPPQKAGAHDAAALDVCTTEPLAFTDAAGTPPAGHGRNSKRAGAFLEAVRYWVLSR